MAQHLCGARQQTELSGLLNVRLAWEMRWKEDLGRVTGSSREWDKYNQVYCMYNVYI